MRTWKDRLEEEQKRGTLVRDPLEDITIEEIRKVLQDLGFSDRDGVELNTVKETKDNDGQRPAS